MKLQASQEGMQRRMRPVRTLTTCWDATPIVSHCLKQGKFSHRRRECHSNLEKRSTTHT